MIGYLVTSASAVSVQDRPVPAEPIQNLGIYVLLFFLFATFSGMVDLVFLGLGAAFLRPVLILSIFGFAVAAVSGRLHAAAKHRIGLIIVVLSFWLCLAVPFSVWPGGAFNTIFGRWQKAAFSFFLAASLICSIEHFKKVLHTIAFSAILLAITALALNHLQQGRLVLEGTRFENPNDLAMMLLAALPCIGYMATGGNGAVKRAIAIGGFMPVLLAIAQTGSRAGVIGFAVLLLLVLFKASFAKKIQLVIVAAVLVLVVGLTLDQYTLERMFTFGSDDGGPAEAVGSAESRKHLLIDSIYLTVRNPILGVGAGMFPVAQDKLAKERGQLKGSWHQTHNTYTEVSSEAGIPALLMFLSMVLYSLRTLSRLGRLEPHINGWHDIRRMAATLWLSLTSLLTFAMFASVFYLPTFPLMFGLVVGLEHVASQQRASSRVAANGAAAARPVAVRRPDAFRLTGQRHHSRPRPLTP